MSDIRPTAAHAVRPARPRAPQLAAFLGVDEAQLAALADRLLAGAFPHGEAPPPPYDVAVRLPPSYPSELSRPMSTHALCRSPRAVCVRQALRDPRTSPAFVPRVAEAAGARRPARKVAVLPPVGALPLLAGAAALYRTHCPVSALAGVASGAAYLVTLWTLCARTRLTLQPEHANAAASGAASLQEGSERRDAALAAVACLGSAAQLVLHGPQPGTLLLLAALLGFLEVRAALPPSLQAAQTLEFDPLGRGRAQSPWPQGVALTHGDGGG